MLFVTSIRENSLTTNHYRWLQSSITTKQCTSLYYTEGLYWILYSTHITLIYSQLYSTLRSIYIETILFYQYNVCDIHRRENSKTTRTVSYRRCTDRCLRLYCPVNARSPSWQRNAADTASSHRRPAKTLTMMDFYIHPVSENTWQHSYYFWW